MESNHVPEMEPWREEVERIIQEWAADHGYLEEPKVPYTRNPRYRDNPLIQKTFEFALHIMDFSELLFEKKKFVVGQQVLKAGTSIAANSREAQNSESRPDFTHKMKIALKEADETELWLLLCNASEHYPNCDELLDELIPIIKILNRIISTCDQYDKR